MNGEMEQVFDYVIIGGGPAGSTLARLMPEDRRVLLVESSGLDDGIKTCGGLIAPDAQRMLGKFGLSLPNSVLVNPQMFFVRSTDLNTGASQKYQRHYLNVDRKRFDNWLISLIPSRVEVRRSTRYLDHTAKNDHIEVTLQTGGSRSLVKTRYLVGADGGQSLVRRRSAGDFKRLTKYVSIQSEFPLESDQTGYEVYFHRGITDFYGWTIPKDGRLLVGVSLKGRNALKKYGEFLSSVVPPEREELGRSSCVIIRPGRRRDFRTHWERRVVFIGEAAGFISPSSAEGFSYAFKSASALASAIHHGGSPIGGYVRRCRSIKLRLLIKRFKSMVIYNQILRNIIFKLGINKL